MLQNDQVSPDEIEEPFLQQFAVVVEPHWSLLSPYINPSESSSCAGADRPVLSHLQTWKRRMCPTYGDLAEILSRLYIQPPPHTGVKQSAASHHNSNLVIFEQNTDMLLMPFSKFLSQLQTHATTLVLSFSQVFALLQCILGKWV